jgi:hypothetical protein
MAIGRTTAARQPDPALARMVAFISRDRSWMDTRRTTTAALVTSSDRIGHKYDFQLHNSMNISLRATGKSDYASPHISRPRRTRYSPHISR